MSDLFFGARISDAESQMKAAAPKDMFAPRKGPGGRGRKRIWVNAELAPLVDVKKCIRPVVSNSNAGTSGTKETKIVPLIAHPTAPADKEVYVLAYEVENVTMRSIDVDAKDDSGRPKWGFAAPAPIADLMDRMDEAEIRHLVNARPGSYVEYPKSQKGDGVDEKITQVESLVLWWALRDLTFAPYVKEVRSDLGLKDKPANWSDEDHAAFSDKLYDRFVKLGRNMDLPTPPPNASFEELKVGGSAPFDPRSCGGRCARVLVRACFASAP